MENRLQHGVIFVATLCFFLVNPAVAGEVSHLLDGMAFVGNNRHYRKLKELILRKNHELGKIHS
jgi:hypothetical protein